MQHKMARRVGRAGGILLVLVVLFSGRHVPFTTPSPRRSLITGI